MSVKTDPVLDAAGAETAREELAERYELLAQLCHKINNPLTSLMGRAQMMQMNKTLDPKLLKSTQVIDESAKRVAALVRELSQVVNEGRQRCKPGD